MSVKVNRLLTFARGILVHGEVERAAADAGALGDAGALRRTGEAWLKHPDVQDVLRAVSRKDVLIEAAKTKAVEAVVHELDSRDGRAAWLKRVIDGTETKIVSKYDVERGERVDVEEPHDMKDRLAAHKMLGLMHGDFVERKEINVNNATRIVAVVYDNGRGPLPADAEVVAELPEDLESGDE